MAEANVWTPLELLELSADTKRAEEVFFATANQTLFNLQAFAYVPYVGALEVYKNGLFLGRGIGFYETSGSSFTLEDPAVAGDVITAVGFVGITGDIIGTTTDDTVNTSDVAGGTATAALNALDVSMGLLTGDVSDLAATVVGLTAQADALDDDVADLVAADVVIDGRLDDLEGIVNAGGLATTYAVNTVTSSNSTLTPQPIIGLDGELTIAAFGVYAFEAFLQFSYGGASTTGVRAVIAGPGSCHYAFTSMYPDPVSPAAVKGQILYGVSTTAAVVAVAPADLPAFGHIHLRGTFTADSSSGTLYVAFSQQTSTASAIVCDAGSWVSLHKII